MNCTSKIIPKVCLRCGSVGCKYCNYTGVPTKFIPIEKDMILTIPSKEICITKNLKLFDEDDDDLYGKKVKVCTDIINCEATVQEI